MKRDFQFFFKLFLFIGKANIIHYTESVYRVYIREHTRVPITFPQQKKNKQTES